MTERSKGARAPDRMKRRVSALTLLVAFAFSACGGRGGGGGTAPPPAGSTLTVEESEFKIAPKELSARAGRITFQIRNAGTVEHNFVVPGTTVNVEAIQPGQSASVTVELPAGSYRVVCTIPGHEEAGMVGTLRVAP